MAAFVLQNVAPFPSVNRGQPLNIGTLSAVNQAFAFALKAPRELGLNKIVISTGGNLSGGTFVLEGSLDAGATWFVIPVVAADIVMTNVPPDTPATFAARYEVSGLAGGCLFRFGATALTSGSGAVWIHMA